LSVCIPHIFLLHLKRRPCESVVPQVHRLGERLRAPGVCRGAGISQTRRTGKRAVAKITTRTCVHLRV
jgi:hypothetical protein